MSLLDTIAARWKRILFAGTVLMLVGAGLVFWQYVSKPRLFVAGLVLMAIGLVGAVVQRLRT